MPIRLVTIIRISLSFIWFYEGLWKKVLFPDPHEVQIVNAAAPFFHLETFTLLTAIGAGETLLAAAILIGIFHRFISAFQALLLLGMNFSGILLGGGVIASPVDLLIHNLPLLLCIAVYGLCGPGLFALNFPRHDAPALDVR